jgi:hypothetical protein
MLRLLIASALLTSPAFAIEVPSQDFYDLVSFLEECREMLITQGAPVPLLTAILEAIRENMSEDGLNVNDAIFDRLKREFEAYEAKYLQPPEQK